MKMGHSLIKPYGGEGVTVPYWDYVGSTMLTNSNLRFTADSQNKQALLWNPVPCSVHNWELQVQFKGHGKGKDLYGDGLAIW
jgi:mannose-binding lectin 2